MVTSRFYRSECRDGFRMTGPWNFSSQTARLSVSAVLIRDNLNAVADALQRQHNLVVYDRRLTACPPRNIYTVRFVDASVDDRFLAYQQPMGVRWHPLLVSFSIQP